MYVDETCHIYGVSIKTFHIQRDVAGVFIFASHYIAPTLLRISVLLRVVARNCLLRRVRNVQCISATSETRNHSNWAPRPPINFVTGFAKVSRVQGGPVSWTLWPAALPDIFTTTVVTFVHVSEYQYTTDLVAFYAELKVDHCCIKKN